MEFKHRIKEARKEMKMTAAEFGKMLGKSEGAVKMWESGRSKPVADTLIDLSKMLDCTTDYLLGLSRHKNKTWEQLYMGVEKALLNQICPILAEILLNHLSTDEAKVAGFYAE